MTANSANSNVQVRYWNNGCSEGIEVYLGENFVTDVQGLRPHQYYATAQDAKNCRRAFRIFMEMHRVFGAPNERTEVPGAVYGRITDAVWHQTSGELEIIQHIMKSA